MKLSFRKAFSEEELGFAFNHFYKKYVGLTFQDDKFNRFLISDISLIRKGKTYYWSVIASPQSYTGLVRSLVKHTVPIVELTNGIYILETK